MVNVAFEREAGGYRMTVTGHAGQGPKGADLVCAACSILAYTLVRRVRALDPAAVRVRDEGDFELFVRAAGGQEAACRGAFETVRAGFELLAENYPKAVKVVG